MAIQIFKMGNLWVSDYISSMTSKEEYLKALNQIVTKLQVKRYSESTCKTYISMFKKFLRYTYPKPIDKIDQEVVMEYLRHLVVKMKVSSSYQNQSINAIKFYFEKVLGRDKTIYEFDRPLKSKMLPRILAKRDVQRLLSSVKNIKHKAILSTIYGCGLRISECIAVMVV